jgi:acetate kinase
MRVLVVNAGSSTLKLRVLDEDGDVPTAVDLPAPRGAEDACAIVEALEGVPDIGAAGHRVVHGGAEFADPVLVDDDVVRRLAAFIDLAPLHQPRALLGIAAVRAALPNTPQVACFDTAFHARIPLAAATYALPRAWTRRLGLRRFGFHGLSHAYASRRAAELMGRDLAGLRLVTCHLGAGVSLAAVRDGRSVDTTMGFTPLEGLVMATRCGDVDPGMLLWLQRQLGLTADELSTELTERSGLLGLAGTADMREAIERAASGDADAALALDVYVHRLRGAVARMAAALNGLDALVFTAGVGEHAPLVRQRTADGLGFLGVAIDPALNARGPSDRELSPAESLAKVFVVTAREDVEIARETREVVSRT